MSSTILGISWLAPRIDGGFLHVEPVHIPKVLGDKSLGQLLYAGPRLGGPLDDLIVQVGEVLDVPNAVIEVFQITAYHIEDDVAHGVADVRRGVGGDAAHVHAHLAGGGSEVPLPAGERIVNLHEVRSSSDATA